MLRPVVLLPRTWYRFSQGFRSPDFADACLLATGRLDPYPGWTLTSKLCPAWLGAQRIEETLFHPKSWIFDFNESYRRYFVPEALFYPGWTRIRSLGFVRLSKWASEL